VITVAEYLQLSFEDGDREYVDGEVVDNHVGDLAHASIRTAVAVFLFNKRKALGAICAMGCHTQVSSTRVRLPGIALVLGERPAGRILDKPPFLVVEVLSPEDRYDERIDDYLRFGVPWIWVIDPASGRGHVYHGGTREAVTDGIYRTQDPPIEMNFAELFD